MDPRSHVWFHALEEIKIEWAKSRNTSAPHRVTVPGALAEVSFMVKDSKRFPDTNG
jgi:hypothetical protein